MYTKETIMSDVSWKKIGTTFGRNFLIGGVLLGLLAVIIAYVRPELAGQMSGAIPASLLFTLIYTYNLTKDRYRTANTARIAMYGGASWLLFALVFYLLMRFTSTPMSVTVALTVTLLLVVTYIIIRTVSLPDGFQWTSVGKTTTHK